MAKPKYEYWLTDEGLTLIQGWARDGLTDEQISYNMGISRSTLNKWKTDHSDISDTIKKGKEVVDREVENALYMSAVGKATSLTKTSKIVNFDEDILRVKRQKWVNEHRTAQEYEKMTKEELFDEAIEHVPTYEVVDIMQTQTQALPNVLAAKFWLGNRKPEKWREKQIQEIQGSVTTNVSNPFDGMSKSELRKMLRDEDG